MNTPLLPAPRVRGNPNRATPPTVIYGHAPRPCIEPAPLNAVGQPDFPKLWGARILITTPAGTFAVRDSDQVGEALALLARARRWSASMAIAMRKWRKRQSYS